MKKIIPYVILFLLTGCAGSSFRPMVDMQGQSRTVYNNDVYS